MKTLFLAIIFSLSLNTYSQGPQNVSQGTIFTPKVKAFMVVTGYGAAGGALLGLASMAFGSSGRAIAQGASLGLYAGMIFGSYILMTHGYSGQDYDNFDDNSRDYDANFSTRMRYLDFEERYSLTTVREGVIMDFPLLNMSF